MSLIDQNIDILFLSVGDIEEDKRREIPLGIAFLCGQLKSQNYTFKILDLYNLSNDLGNDTNIFNNIDIFIERYKPKVIGISATSYYIPQVKEITDHLHNLSASGQITNQNIILGGYISIIPDAIEQTGVDIICIGEGDFTILELMDYFTFRSKFTDLNQISGIIFKNVVKNEENTFITTKSKPLIENLDLIALPDFSEFNLKDYKFNDSLPFYSTRGCYNKCTYCDIFTFYGDNYVRRMSPERILEYIEDVRTKFNVKRIDFMNDNFLTSRQHISRFFELLHEMYYQKDQQPLIKINFQSRANDVLRFKELLIKYKEFINCIEVGTESYSQSQLDRWKKNITVLDNINVAKILSKNNIPYINYYLWIDEHTTISELDENVNQILDLPEVPIINNYISNVSVPNWMIFQEMSAIYDKLGNSSVRNIPFLKAVEEFLNETNELANKVGVIYIGLKTLIKSTKIKNNKAEEIAQLYFPMAERIMKERLFLMVEIAEIIIKIKIGKKKQYTKILNEFINRFTIMAEKILLPIDKSLGIDVNSLIDY